DMIEIDIHAKKINLKLSDRKIQERIDGLPEFTPKIDTGYLARYAKIVSSADKGAVFPK
ncbi:MAG: dihydroxy-acid dehydratase, partial [Desulfobacula sp.]|nr:dihydroxy-acid dehydratase [Desulfobacula sp.]